MRRIFYIVYQRINNLFRYVNPQNDMGDFMGMPREILEDGFMIECKDKYEHDECVVFLPNTSDSSKWDVYQADNWGYTKRGEMMKIKASAIDIVRIANSQ